jgi:uncharacterized protein YbjT (DUF2867 family)
VVDAAGRTIAITGVTGTQGGAAARQLIATGWRVRGLTRNASGEGARRAAAAGVELVEGDMGDPMALDRLMRDAYGAYAVTDFFRNGLEREVQQGRAVADAAARAGVKHVVFPSLALSDQNTGIPYFEAKVAIERHIAALKLPATVLRISIFMEDLVVSKYAPPIWWGTVRRTVGPDKRLFWIAAEDVGAIVARVFAAPEKWIGRAIMLAGDFKSFNEAREVFRRVTGKTPLGIPAPLWLCRRVVNADLVPMWEWLGRNPVEGDMAPVRELHPDTKDMESWLRARQPATRRATPAPGS